MAKVVINEICAANGDVILEPTSGNFAWLELHNPTSSGKRRFLVHANRWSCATQQVVDSGKHNHSSQRSFDYLCDGGRFGYHAGFSLSARVRTIVLSTNAGAELGSYLVSWTIYQYIIGREPPMARAHGNIRSRHPRANNSGSLESTRYRLPNVSKSSGRYAGSVTVALSHTNSGADIRYTTNGSEPTSGSLKYNSSITLSSRRSLKPKPFMQTFHRAKQLRPHT